MPASSLESWTVLGDDDLPVGPVERYLAYLTDIERSPNTIKAYAHDLKDWFTFLDLRGLDWREVALEDLGEFVAWLRLPPAGRDRRVVILPSVEHQVSAATVNRKLSAVNAFYLHAARQGVDLGGLLVTWGPAGHRGGWKPFLHHISKSQPAARRTIALKTPRKLPRVLTADEVQMILDACGRLRDRLLFAVLYDTGMRVGEAIRLDRADIDWTGAVLTIRESKFGKTRMVPVLDSTLITLERYARTRDQLCPQTAPAGFFVSTAGTRLIYACVGQVFRRLRDRAGIGAGADHPPRIHDLRHTFAVRTLLGWYRAGDDVEARLPILSTYLGHRDPRSTYWYLSAAPELLALAAGRLEWSQEVASR
jgi:integrase